MNERTGPAARRVLALVGTYRKGGVVDSAVDAILAAAAAGGAVTEKIYLIDEPIEFCTNCRACTQEPGPERGRCPLPDAVPAILDRLERADALVFASPVNFGTVTAVAKRFIERLVCYAEWPWGAAAPKVRRSARTKPLAVVIASAAPSVAARLSGRAVAQWKQAAGLVGGRTIGVLAVGLAAGAPRQELGGRACRKARRLGARLAR